jgi:hypothetical protein
MAYDTFIERGRPPLHPSTPPPLYSWLSEDRMSRRPGRRVTTTEGTEKPMNFCTHCGNRLRREERRWVWLSSWWRAYQCQECRSMRQPRRRPYQRLALFLLVAALSIPVGRRGWRGLTGNQSARIGSPVSAIDATARRIPETREDEPTSRNPPGTESGKGPVAETYYCGALTRRGTPCRRPVRQGERCAQHRRGSVTPARPRPSDVTQP